MSYAEALHAAQLFKLKIWDVIAATLAEILAQLLRYLIEVVWPLVFTLI